MFRRVVLVLMGLTIFVLGSYAELWFHVTPLVTAVLRTGKMLLGDIYTAVADQIPGEINTTSAMIALAGFAALASLRYIIRARKM